MPLTDSQKVVRNDTAKRMATALEGIETALGGLGTDNAKKTDLTSVSATGTTNATGATITAGTYFYLNGSLVQAKTDIASGATFTNGTNYEAVTAGGLNSLNAGLASLNSQIANLFKTDASTSQLDNSFKSTFEAAFTNASAWNEFHGGTSDGSEGAWIGYKRIGHCTALIIQATNNNTHSLYLACRDNSSGTFKWTYKVLLTM